MRTWVSEGVDHRAADPAGGIGGRPRFAVGEGWWAAPHPTCYNAGMSSTLEHDAANRLLTPISQCFTPDVARRLVNAKIDDQTQARIEELADKNTPAR